MARSVSCHPYAIVNAFTHVDSDDCWEHEELIQGWQDHLIELWPSLRPVRDWEYRECQIIAENAHCKISVQEYCGLVSFSLIPRVDDPATAGIAYRWCQSIAPKFKKTFGTLRHVATFSNGEAVFERTAA